MEADAHAVFGDEDDFVVAVGHLDADEPVTLFDVDADDAAFADVLERAEDRLLDDAGAGGHQEVIFVVEFFDA